MEDYEKLKLYRSVSPLIVKAIKKEIQELGDTKEEEPVKGILLQRKAELEVILEKIEQDLEESQ